MPKYPVRRNFLDEMFRDFPLGYSVAPLHGDPLPAPGKIKIDVKESGDNLVVHAEMPGLDKDAIDVSVDNNVLTIRAEVSQYDAEKEDEKVIHSERYYGAIARSVALPVEVASDQALAKYENGILTLTLPKARKEASRKIAVA